MFVPDTRGKQERAGGRPSACRSLPSFAQEKEKGGKDTLFCRACLLWVLVAPASPSPQGSMQERAASAFRQKGEENCPWSTVRAKI